MARYPMPTPDEDSNVQVIVANLKEGFGILFGTPIIRSLFVVGAFMFVAFGLWNVLLLPFSIEELGATEFEYGLQEGLTSLGFVAGSFMMARYAKVLPEPAWIFGSLVVMGVLGIGYALSTTVPVAILLVTLSGFAQPPSSVSRSVLLQRHTPREARGRVFSAFYVLRDVIFLIGMAGAGLADVVDIRLLIVIASCLLFVSAAFTLVAPGLGVSTWRTAAARLAPALGAPALAALPVRAATLADFDRLIGKLPTFARLSDDQRSAFVKSATVREVPAGTRVLEHGDPASSAYFILDGVDQRRRPRGGRALPRSLDDARRRLLRRDRRPDRQPAHGRRRRRRGRRAARGPGRIAAGDDVRARDPATRVLDAHLAAAADPGRRPAASGRSRPGGPARPAHAQAQRRGAPALVRRGRHAS